MLKIAALEFKLLGAAESSDFFYFRYGGKRPGFDVARPEFKPATNYPTIQFPLR